MVDFTSDAWIERAIELTTPILKKIEQKGVHYTNRQEWDALAPSDYFDASSMAVYSKCRDIFLFKLKDELGIDDLVEYSADVICDEGFLYVKAGNTTYTLEEGYWDQMYDVFSDDCFIQSGPFFWPDGFEASSGYCEIEELADCFFTQKAVDEYFHDIDYNELSEMTYEEFCEKCPETNDSLKGLWKKQYAEEMTKALYKDFRGIFEETTDENATLRYLILVNVAIEPFLKALRKYPKLRREKASKFAITLIKNLRWMSPYSCSLNNCMYGHTENLYFCTQEIGSCGYSEIFPCCMSLMSEISMTLIDYVLAYLDNKYGFLPPDVRQMWRKHVNKKAVKPKRQGLTREILL